jgi:hypothetical protein
MRGGGVVRRALLAIAAALVWSCSSSSEDTGVLGRGQFRYLCSGQGDFACTGLSGASDVDLPGAIAVGATFRIGYAPTSGDGVSTVQGQNGYDIVPASSEIALSSGDTIKALRAGYVALLAQHVGNSNVDDFVHLKLSPIAQLNASPSTLSLAAGEEQRVTLLATDAVGATLAGQLGCQWQVSGSTGVVALQGGQTSGVATVQGTADGTATLHATCGGASVDVEVTVSGAAVGDGGTHD